METKFKSENEGSPLREPNAAVAVNVGSKDENESSSDEDMYMSTDEEDDDGGWDRDPSDPNHPMAQLIDSSPPENWQAIFYSAEHNGLNTQPELPQTLDEQGAAIAYGFDPAIEYPNEEDVDIFDDGLEKDEDSDSTMSDNFEELEDPTSFTKVLRIPASDCGDESGGDISENAFDDQKDPWGSEDLESESGTEAVDATPAVDSPATVPSPAGGPRTLEKLQEHKFATFYKKASGISKSRQSDLESYRWELKELEEARSRIESRMPEVIAEIAACEAKLDSTTAQFDSVLKDSGVSQALFEEYEAFCESLNPEFGQRGGLSITCHTDHGNSYVEYDPTFQIFKDHIEGPYHTCHFRCEASTLKSTTIKGGLTEHIVEFWPIQSLVTEGDNESTWRGQYPVLYQLAADAAREGSIAAMDMLVSLPDMNSSCKGGWLLDYKFEEALKDETVKSKRWRFRSAHKIDAPASVEQKKLRLQLMLRPEDIR